MMINGHPLARDDWRNLAFWWSLHSTYTLQSLAAELPEPVACTTCWDHGLCAECLGEYPDHCPNGCGDGRCTACGRKADYLP